VYSSAFAQALHASHNASLLALHHTLVYSPLAPLQRVHLPHGKLPTLF